MKIKPGITVAPLVPPPPDSGYVNIPPIAIQHKERTITFNDSPLLAFEMENIIILGASRQRSMFNWNDADPAKKGLQCESRDFEHGLPTFKFPWEDSNFDKIDQPVDTTIQLDCGSCVFAHWTKDPSAHRGSRQAPCVELLSVYMLVPDVNQVASETEGVLYAPYRLGQMSFKKSSLTEMMNMLRACRADSKAPYEFMTSIKLDTNLGSGFEYSVPKLAHHSEVSPSVFPHLSTILAACREFTSKPAPPPVRVASTGFFGESLAVKTASGYSGTFFS